MIELDKINMTRSEFIAFMDIMQERNGNCLSSFEADRLTKGWLNRTAKAMGYPNWIVAWEENTNSTRRV